MTDQEFKVGDRVTMHVGFYQDKIGTVVSTSTLKSGRRILRVEFEGQQGILHSVNQRRVKRYPSREIEID